MKNRLPYKIVSAIDKAIDIFLAIIFLGVFLYGVYATYDAVMLYKKAADTTDLKMKKAAESGDSQDLPDGYIAWLEVPGTNLDYPVMQGIDNTEYLNKDPYGNYSLSGSIFLDSNNAPDFSDPVNLIYGHHMQYGYMFGSLDDFLKQKYFDKHNTGSITVGKTYYKITFLAAYNTSAEDNTIYDVQNTSKDAVLSEVKQAGVRNDKEIDVTDQTDKLIILSTCKDAGSDERTVLVGKIRQSTKPKAKAEKTTRLHLSVPPFMAWIILAGAVIVIIMILKWPKRGNQHEENQMDH